MKNNQCSNHTSYGLDNHGLTNLNEVFWNLPSSRLYEKILTRGEGRLSHLGPIVVRTGHHTGRSARDKFIVEESSTKKDIWWGANNPPISKASFEQLHKRMTLHLQTQDIYVQDCFAGADPDHRMPVRIITQYAWHSLFARNMFIQPDEGALKKHIPAFTVIDAPHFHSSPALDGTNSETFVIINFKQKLILIGGTSYAGEIKKSIFTVMNYLMPHKGVLPMHCSANISPAGETALFFGLSGTGKTTLSADAARTLIGDDEHGWSDNGVFNFEGGCYAKLIRLSPEAEPEIYSTTKRFGTILENVSLDSCTRRVDLDDDTFTENTRGSYHISAIPNASTSGMGGHPKTIIFLSADAFGVLPPIARLTREQAMYHFISGYTARVAGTERGVTEPTPAFSACYGAPFMPMHPMRYAELLGQKLDRHGARVWLINTGWSGGPAGIGTRMSIAHTRAMVNAALNGKLDDVATETEPFFGLQIPLHCPDVPDKVLNPCNTWASPDAYRAQAEKLAGLFAKNFQQFADQTTREIRQAGPSL
ncbi:MAG: phosphoenolpyruvate carboxykinase (ATP) [Deltaproteobacteria bacterium]|nr:phosphoenolpyruvate carboxykinase (ATP) [Deltaproteobacteria bacterium]